MSIPTDKQGTLGDLSKKSNTELMELLQRQEKILHNRMILKKLPDGGEKVRNLVARIQHVLAERKKAIDHTSSIFERLRINDASMDTDDTSILSQLSQEARDEKLIADERKDLPNIYSKIMKTDLEAGQSRRFRPFKSSNTTAFSELPAESIQMLKELKPAAIADPADPSVQPKGVQFNNTSSPPKESNPPCSGEKEPQEDAKRHTVRDIVVLKDGPSRPGVNVPMQTNKHVQKHTEEDSTAHWKTLSNKAPVVLPLNESLKLLQDQKQKQEDIHSKLATEKLMQRLGQKMKVYNPEGSMNLSYRDGSAEHEESSDEDDEKETDYPE